MIYIARRIMPRRSPNDPIPESKKELEQKIKELEGQVQKWKDCSCKSVDWEYVDKLEKALAEKDKEISDLKKEIHDIRKEKWELENENKELKWINGETLEKIRKVGKEQAIQSERDKHSQELKALLKWIKNVPREDGIWTVYLEKKVLALINELSEPKKREGIE